MSYKLQQAVLGQLVDSICLWVPLHQPTRAGQLGRSGIHSPLIRSFLLQQTKVLDTVGGHQLLERWEASEGFHVSICCRDSERLFYRPPPACHTVVWNVRLAVASLFPRSNEYNTTSIRPSAITHTHAHNAPAIRRRSILSRDACILPSSHPSPPVGQRIEVVSHHPPAKTKPAFGSLKLSAP